MTYTREVNPTMKAGKMSTERGLSPGGAGTTIILPCRGWDDGERSSAFRLRPAIVHGSSTRPLPPTAQHRRSCDGHAKRSSRGCERPKNRPVVARRIDVIEDEQVERRTSPVQPKDDTDVEARQDSQTKRCTQHDTFG